MLIPSCTNNRTENGPHRSLCRVRRTPAHCRGPNFHGGFQIAWRDYGKNSTDSDKEVHCKSNSKGSRRDGGGNDWWLSLKDCEISLRAGSGMGILPMFASTTMGGTPMPDSAAPTSFKVSERTPGGNLRSASAQNPCPVAPGSFRQQLARSWPPVWRKQAALQR